MKLSLMLIILMSLSNDAQATNHTYLIGGGGEVEDKTIFDNSVKDLVYLNKFAKPENQNIYFDGGHSVIEKTISNLFPKVPKNNFMVNDYANFLAKIKSDIENDVIKTGDQVLISLHTHGALKGPGELSHSIALKSPNQKDKQDLVSLKGMDIRSLDDLKVFIDLAEKKGVKVGIIDSSCYGGSTVNLGLNKKHICVISPTNEEMPNYLNNPRLFFQKRANDSSKVIKDNFDNSENLEDLLLNLSDKVDMPVMPHSSISKFIDITNKLQKQLYSYAFPELLSKGGVDECYTKDTFLNNFEKILTEYYSKNIIDIPEYKKFIKEVDAFEKTAKTKKSNVENLKKLYALFTNFFINNFEVNFLDESLKTKENGDFKLTKLEIVQGLKVEELKKMDFFEVLTEEQKTNVIKNYTNESKKIKSEGQDILNKIEVFSGASDSKHFWGDLRRLTKTFNQLRNKLYKLESNQSESNACRDFKI